MTSSRRTFVTFVVALLTVSLLASPAAAERKALHITGYLSVPADPGQPSGYVYPYSGNTFDAVLIYENQIDTVVTGTDPIPATAHAVDVTGLDSTNLAFESQKQFLFKTYPLQPEYVAGAIEFPNPNDLSQYVPDPAGYSGWSFYRWQGTVGDPFPSEPGDVVFPRARNGSKGAVDPLRITVADDATSPAYPGITADVMSIIDHINTSISTSDMPYFLTPDPSSGYIGKPTARFELANIDLAHTSLSSSDLPTTFDTDELVTPPWGFGTLVNAPDPTPDYSIWDGGYAVSLSPPNVDIQEVQFGDANLDGVVDATDKAIFEANLDNNLDGYADNGGAFLYETGVTTDDPDTPEVEPAQPIGFATWLLGDFNNDGFVTDADGVYFLLPGDGNGDGSVDGLDYLIWAANFGTHPGPDGDVSDGDYNDDGWIDGLDYLLWAANFGSHNASAVPEPGGFGLMMLAVVGWYARRRR